MGRPAKRVRTGAAPWDDLYEDDELNYEPEQVSLSRDPGFHRAVAQSKLKSTFEHIFEKYERDFSGIGDEIDLRTGEILIDNGHLSHMANEKDTGRGRTPGLDEDEEDIVQRDDDGAVSKSTAFTQRQQGSWRVGTGRLSTISSLGDGLFGPFGSSKFSFGTWDKGGEATDPTWRAPEIQRPTMSSFATALLAQRYELPVRDGSHSLWNPGPDTEEDREDVLRPKISAALVPRQALPVVRYGTGMKSGRHPVSLDDEDDEEDILVAECDTTLIIRNPRPRSGKKTGAVSRDATAAKFAIPHRPRERKDRPDSIEEKSRKQGYSSREPAEGSKIVRSYGLYGKGASVSGTSSKSHHQPLRTTKQVVAARVTRPRRSPSPDLAVPTSSQRSGNQANTTRMESLKKPLSRAEVRWLVTPQLRSDRTFYIDIPLGTPASFDDVEDFVEISGDMVDGMDPATSMRETGTVVDHRLPTPPGSELVDPTEEGPSSGRDDRQFVPDSQDDERGLPSSPPPPFMSTNATLSSLESRKVPILDPAPAERFYRNEIDPDYDFSDEDDLLAQKRERTQKEATSLAKPTTPPIAQLEKPAQDMRKRKRDSETNKTQIESIESSPKSVERKHSTPKIRTYSRKHSRRTTETPKVTTEAGGSSALVNGKEQLATKMTPTFIATDRQSQAASTPWQCHDTVAFSRNSTSRSRNRVRFMDDVTAEKLVETPLSKPAPKLRYRKSETALKPTRVVKPSPSKERRRPVSSDGLSTKAVNQVRTPPNKNSLGMSPKDSISRNSITSFIVGDDDEEDELTLSFSFTPKGSARLVQDHAHTWYSRCASSKSSRKRASLPGCVSNSEAVPHTPKDLGRRKGLGREGARPVDPNSPSAAELVRTPGGTLRRCGEDGFQCERDFCFTCL